MKALKGVYLSDALDLAGLYARAFEPYSETLTLALPEAVADPEAITFALAWKPAPEAFAPYPNLRLVSSIAAGVDNILSCPSLPPNAQVMRLRDPDQAKEMSGFALWHIIGWHREMARYGDQQRAGIWRRNPYHLASDIRVAILGFGLMGETLANSLLALDYQVIVYAKRPREGLPDNLTIVCEADGKLAAAGGADIVVNLLPATPETMGVLDAELISVMAAGGLLINLGRGNHLVEEDLLAALDEKHLSHAALDVTAEEPLPPTHPFWTHPAITLTPHIAAETPPERLTRLVAREVERARCGKPPLGLVDRVQSY